MSGLGPGVQFNYLPSLFAYGLINAIVAMTIYLILFNIRQVLLFNVKLWLLVVPFNIQLNLVLMAYYLLKSYKFKIRLS